MNDKRILGTVFALQLTEGRATVVSLGRRLELDLPETRERVKDLRKRGLLRSSGALLSPTRKGRETIRVVFIGGGFEIIHSGHVHTIRRAKELGDVLVAVVARDSTIRRRKGRKPVSGERERAELLASMRQVDAAILGSQGDIYETLEKVRPDVVALGYDQHHAEADILKEGARRGMKLKVVRLDSPTPGVKTSRILKET